MEKKEQKRNNNGDDGLLTFLKGAKYLSLFVAILSGARLASIMWQKSILQLFVEGWTNDFVSILLTIILLFFLGGMINYTEAKRVEREVLNKNYAQYKEEYEREREREKEMFKRMM